MSAAPRWRYAPWAALTRDELHRLLLLRQRVFVVEQTCAYLDVDGWDPRASHLWTEATAPDPTAPGAGPGDRDGDGTITVATACLRVFAPGVKYAEASLGRIATAPEARGTGLGRALVQEGLDRLVAAHGPVPVRIGAQRYLERFYGDFGFVTISPEYLDDGIPHVDMLRSAH